MADNDKKVNNQSPDEQQKIYEEINNSTFEMASEYVDENLSREERLRLEAERKNKAEMEAIKADIERRYMQEIEESNRKIDYISTVDLEEKKANLDEIINLDALKDSGNASSAKAKKQKKEKKRKPTQYVDFSEKSYLYFFTYMLGDAVSKFFSFIFGNVFGILAMPFAKLKSYMRAVRYNKRRKSKDSNLGRDAAQFRGEIRKSLGTIFKSLRHPLSTPFVIWHYIKLSVQRHSLFLKTAVNTALPIISALILFGVFSYWNHVTFALDVIYNDKSIGYISNEAVFIEAKELVMDRLYANNIQSEETTAASGNLNAGYKLALVSYDELNDARTISDKMIENSVDNLTHACGIYIDDKFVCAVKNEADAKTVFYNIIKPYEQAANEGGYVVGLVQNIDYIQGLYKDDEDVMWDAGRLEDYIAANKLINIKKTVTSSEIKEVPYATVTTRDLTKFSGYRVIRQAGVSGTKRVITTKVYVDDKLSNTYTTDEILVEPVKEIIVVGTKTTMGGVYIGQASSMGFLWPAPSCHYISSPYGWRSSGWHKGVDLCTSNGTARGTPVIASRSGTVEVVQHSASGYGNMVLINHGDGYKTRYAHMLEGSVTVRIGQYVEGGTTIGRVGSTGNSSGPHLHFEVIYNGETQNPINFIR